MNDPGSDDALAFTVASIWREARVSCPHPDLIASHRVGALTGGQAEFLRFHLEESRCPFCNAILADLDARDDRARAPALADLRDRLLRSTVAALRTRR